MHGVSMHSLNDPVGHTIRDWTLVVTENRHTYPEVLPPEDKLQLNTACPRTGARRCLVWGFSHTRQTASLES